MKFESPNVEVERLLLTVPRPFIVYISGVYCMAMGTYVKPFFPKLPIKCVFNGRLYNFSSHKTYMDCSTFTEEEIEATIILKNITSFRYDKKKYKPQPTANHIIRTPVYTATTIDQVTPTPPVEPALTLDWEDEEATTDEERVDNEINPTITTTDTLITTTEDNHWQGYRAYHPRPATLEITPQERRNDFDAFFVDEPPLVATFLPMTPTTT